MSASDGRGGLTMEQRVIGLRKTLKILHTLSSCGLIGGIAAYMLLLLTAPQDTAAAYADLRGSIHAITQYVIMPSLVIAVISGLLAMAAHQPYLDKGWVWIKLALGLPLFEGTLVHLGGKAREAEEIARKIATEGAPQTMIEEAVAREWGGLWVIMALSLAQVIIGIWRPRLKRSKAD